MSNNGKKVTPLKAIRQYCIWCGNGSNIEVKFCTVYSCPLYSLRFGKRVSSISPLKTIRKKCHSCGEGTAHNIRNCEFDDCPCFTYRFGKNPSLKGKRGRGNPNFGKIATTFRENSDKKGIVVDDLSPVSVNTAYKKKE